MKSVLGQSLDFKNKTLLQQALTHRSADKTNNERLEFLGDSILSFVVTKWLYHNYPKLSEGKLSRMRSSLVKGDTLAEIAKYYNLGQFLILGVGELKSGGFNRSSVLADAVEAIYGAVFLDQGIDIAEKFILSVMDKWLQNVDPNTTDKDAKTRLQEYLQDKGLLVPHYKLQDKFGKDHLQTFRISCTVKSLDISESAEHRSRKKAEQKAAQKVLNTIESQL
jgi:ribonuclease-3